MNLLIKLSLAILWMSLTFSFGAVPSTTDFDPVYFRTSSLPVTLVGTLTNWSKLSTNLPSAGGTNIMVSTITSGTTISPTLAINGLSSTAASCRRVTFRLNITNDITTVNAPAGTLIDGDSMVWEVIQPGAATHTISGWDTKYKFGTDITSIVLSATVSKRDFITFLYNSTSDAWYCIGFVRGY